MRDWLLRSCLLAYPAAVRKRDGRAILDLATDLAGDSDWAAMKEAVGMLVGGLAARLKIVWFDFTGAPWRAALEWLALPSAVAMLCLFVGYVIGVYPGVGHWMGWWALLGLLGGLVAVLGAASGRRAPTVVSAMLLASLLAYDASVGLGSGYSRWWGNVYVGQLNVLGMWLPVALLLFVCSWTVGRIGLHRERATVRWITSVPVVLTGIICSAVARFQPVEWSYPNTLGGLFVWVPLTLVAVLVVLGVARRNPVTRTAASILVLAATLPFMWAFSMFLREPYGPEQYILLTYWLPGIVIACAIALMLLRRRETPRWTPVRPPGADERDSSL